MKRGWMIALLISVYVLSIALAVLLTWLLLRPTPAGQTNLPSQANAPVSNNTQASNETSTPGKTPTKSEATKIPDDWEQFANVEHEVEFSYPPEWGQVKADMLTGLGDSMYKFPELSLGFGDGIPIMRSLRVAKIDDIMNTSADFAGLTEAVDDLLQVYQLKSVAELTPDFTAPPVNAGLYGYTDPIYIQNPSGSFGGFYAYTRRVQDDPQFEDAIELTELTLQLTDGDIIVQALISVDPTEPINFTAASSCNPVDEVIAPGKEFTSCAIPRELDLDRQNLETLVASLDHLKSL